MNVYTIVPDWSAEGWSAAGTWATALVALAAAVFAWRQVVHARELREAQAQPFIIATLEPSAVDESTVMLRVENIGHTLAREVRFTFNPPLASALADKDSAYSLAESRLVKEGLASVPPGMKVERIFDRATEWPSGGEGVNLAYDVTVTFSDHRGEPQDPLEYRIDLSPYLDGLFMPQKNLHDVARSLEKIGAEVGKWSEPGGGLKAISRDGDARDEWRRQRAAEKAERARQDRDARGQTQASAPRGESAEKP